MKIQLQQILKALPVLRAWLGGDAGAPKFRVGLAYKLSLLAKELDEHLAACQDALHRIIRGNAAQVTEDGYYSFIRGDGTVDEEALRRAEEAVRELWETEVELRHAIRLSLQDLEDAGVRVTVAEIDAISWLLEVEQDEHTA